MTIVCFGEMLLRLAPFATSGTGVALCNADTLTINAAGAEANVAISLASLGTLARMATLLPDNALGDHALAALAANGVDISTCIRRPGRMGLFFIESPQAGREGGFFYDRAGSAFACEASAIDWEQALSGATWLHLSGLTAALGEVAISAMRQAVTYAQQQGVMLSFDCNYRPLLWKGRDGEAATLLREFAGAAQLLFASDWDARLIMGDSTGDGSASALLHALPNLRWVASTRRSDHNGKPFLGAALASRTGTMTIAPTPITPFNERIGAGDAFAAGLLHALAAEWDARRALRFAHRACIMKHAIHGDFSTLSADDIGRAIDA